MGAAARKPASTAPAEPAADMSVASALRANAPLHTQGQGHTQGHTQGQGRARGVLSEEVDALATDRSEVERRAPDAAVSTPERTPRSTRAQARTNEQALLTPVSVLESSEDMLEEFDSDVDIDEDPTTQSISILRRTGAQIIIQNQQLEREVEMLRKQLEELEKLEQDAVVRSPVRKAWHSSNTTPASARATASKSKLVTESQMPSPPPKRSLTGGVTPSTVESNPSPQGRPSEEKKHARKSSALRGLNDKRRHTYHQHNSGAEPRHQKTSASTSDLNRFESSPLKHLDMMTVIAEEMKGSPTGASDWAMQESSTSAQENDARAWSNTLTHKWVEVELLLRRPITCDEDVMYSMAASEAGLLFMEQLDKTAKSLHCLRGAISRWILPYDASTSVADQSSMIRQVLDNTPDDLQGKLSEKHISYLVAGANSVRKLVRVKIADDNDLEQARLALITALEFFQRLQQHAKRVGLTPFEALQENAQGNV